MSRCTVKGAFGDKGEWLDRQTGKLAAPLSDPDKFVGWNIRKDLGSL